MWRDPSWGSVAVHGGELAVATWGRGPHSVVGLHGITANHASFGEVAAALARRYAEVTLHVPDLRGRGRSAGLPGPFGLARHADDVLALIDGLGLARPTLVGHSMGAYVAALVARRAPGRVGGVVLVDGGLPLEVDLPEGTSDLDAIHAVVGPAIDRLRTTYPDEAAHEATFRQHPALTGRWTATLSAYTAADRVPTEDGRWRSPVSIEAVAADGAGPLRDPEVRRAAAELAVPATLLTAPRGLRDEPGGLCTADAVADLAVANRHVRIGTVADVNHYTIVFDPRAADQVAAAVLDVGQVRV